MEIPTLPGVQAKIVTTDRIKTRVLFAGPEDGERIYREGSSARGLSGLYVDERLFRSSRRNAGAFKHVAGACDNAADYLGTTQFDAGKTLIGCHGSSVHKLSNVGSK